MIGAKNDQAMISVLELKRLLIELREKCVDVCIRPRLIGEMWYPQFLRVALLTEKGVLFHDENTNRFMSIADISSIMQFELDKRFQNFQPYFHYIVTSSAEI
jgi:hypothetical protein